MSNFDGVAKHSFYLSLLILRKQVHFPGRQKPGASRLPGLPLPARNEDISGENLLFLARYPRGNWAMEPGGAKVPAAPGELQVIPASASSPKEHGCGMGKSGNFSRHTIGAICKPTSTHELLYVFLQAESVHARPRMACGACQVLHNNLIVCLRAN